MRCGCEFCNPCPYCGHKADEHMAGDFSAGICFICQKQDIENCHNQCTCSTDFMSKADCRIHGISAQLTRTQME